MGVILSAETNGSVAVGKMLMWLVRFWFTFVLPCLRLVNASEKANWALLTVVHLPVLVFWAIDLFLVSCSTTGEDTSTEQVDLSGTTLYIFNTLVLPEAASKAERVLQALDAGLAFTYNCAFGASCACYTVIYACQHPLRCGRHLFPAFTVSNVWLPHSEVAASFLPLEQTTSLLQPVHRFMASVQLARVSGCICSAARFGANFWTVYLACHVAPGSLSFLRFAGITAERKTCPATERD